MKSVEIINEQQFTLEVKKELIPVIVVFYAKYFIFPITSWCPPCKELSPLLNQWIGETNGKVKLVTVDVGSANYLASLYDVSAMPTVCLFFKGYLEASNNFRNLKS